MKIAIIGAGAAGMMCAAVLAENSKYEIHIFDKNSKPGVKVSYTGGGRCNLTTAINDRDILQKKYIRGGKFLVPALNAFSPAKAFEWFENHGLELKVEANYRVFPKSDNSYDVIDVFAKIFERCRVRLHYSEAVVEIKKEGDGFGVKTGESDYLFDKVVLTTGGNTFPQTGSTGDGYEFARKFGHFVTKLSYSLNSFAVADSWCKELSGLSFENAALKFTLDGKQITTMGPVLLTHYGISGPNVFEMAAHLAYEEITNIKSKTVYFRPYANLTMEKWNEKLTTLIEANGAKQISSLLESVLPKKFAAAITQIARIDRHKKSAEITREERNQLAKLLGDGLPLMLTSKSAGNEFVTAGGVKLDEIDRKTMQSKFVQGLFLLAKCLILTA